MNEPLFLDTSLQLEGAEKLAGMLTRLSDMPENWSQEIAGEAHKQIPYLSAFEWDVHVHRADEERGFAFGAITVRPRSSMTITEEQDRGYLPKAFIPFVVRNNMMAPLDVFVSGKRYQYLTEPRLRGVLFRPDVFDVVRERPPEAPLYNELVPPTGGGIGQMGKTAGKVGLGSKLLGFAGSPIGTTGLIAGGMGGGVAAANKYRTGSWVGAEKKAAAVAAMGPVAVAVVYEMGGGLQKNAGVDRGGSVLDRLDGRVLPEHVDRVKTALLDPSVHAAWCNSPCSERLERALLLEHTNPEKTASAMWERIRPTAIQFRKTSGGGFIAKVANAEMYQPQETPTMDWNAVRQMGLPHEDMRFMQETDGTVTMSPDAAVKETMDTQEYKVVDTYGTWLTQDVMGNQLYGLSFPQLLTFDMKPMPLTLFTNGSQFGLQEHIAGTPAGKSADIPRGAIQGHGCFFYLDKGTAKAFIPLLIKGTNTGTDGVCRYQAEDYLGQPVSFYLSDQVKMPMQISMGDFAIPSSFGWIPLRTPVELISEPHMMAKTAAKPGSTVDLFADGGAYTFRGAPVEKLALDQRQGLHRADAELLAATMGMHRTLVKTALDRAARGQLVKVAGMRSITPAAERMKEARASVRRDLSSLRVPIRNYNLIKEASLLDDSLTVDKILGLGFINAENVSSFVDMLPDFEQASSRLAEMLVAVRVGLNDIPEVAIERCLAAVDDVISGLRSLLQQEKGFKE